VGGLEELHFQVLPRRRIDLLILDRLEEALSLLRETQTVSSVDIHTLKNENGRQRISFEFDGDDRMLSELLSTLVQAQIPVLHFREDERDLEEVFLRATRGIVS
jgi:hypothetical protein